MRPVWIVEASGWIFGWRSVRVAGVGDFVVGFTSEGLLCLDGAEEKTHASPV
jgi:hypothetical protein